MEIWVSISSMVYGQDKIEFIDCIKTASLRLSGVRKTNEMSRKSITTKERKNATLSREGLKKFNLFILKSQAIQIPKIQLGKTLARKPIYHAILS